MRWLARGEEHLPAGDALLVRAGPTAAPGERDRSLARESGRTASTRSAGRLVAQWTAMQAMSLLYPASVDELEVRQQGGGAPEAYRGGIPLPVGMSLTDRAGWAVCLLGLEPGAVGCDLELVEPRSPGFVTGCFTRQEQRIIGSDPLLASLLWSAKESALKVLGDFVLTVAADRPTPPPRCLEEPSALSSATPSHTSRAHPTS